MQETDDVFGRVSTCTSLQDTYTVADPSVRIQSLLRLACGSIPGNGKERCVKGNVSAYICNYYGGNVSCSSQYVMNAWYEVSWRCTSTINPLPSGWFNYAHTNTIGFDFASESWCDNIDAPVTSGTISNPL